MKPTALFLFFWLMIGFSLGTSVLLGPVRWLVSSLRKSRWPAGPESAAVIGIIVLLVCVSAAVALLLARITLHSYRREIRFGLPLMAFLSAAGAIWIWMNPADLGDAHLGAVQDEGMRRRDQPAAGPRFTFGPYPDEDRLKRLRGEGYDAVVSLLHPAVLPFEPILLAREKGAAARAGIELIHLPMLPWVSENTEALESMRGLANGGAGRYYVHCYLGADRVQLVRRIVVEAGSAAGVETVRGARRLAAKRFMERGDVYRLDERVYLTPYPTDVEFMSYFVTGEVSRVVSLLDPRAPEDLPWIEKEEKILSRYEVPFLNLPVSLAAYDPHEVLEIARKVRRLSGTIVVHAFLSPSSGRSAAAEGFLQAYRSDLPPLPPSSFEGPLEAGPVEVIAPHVAVGPTPTGPEFGSYLYRAGVREVVYLVGDSDSRLTEVDQAAAAEARLPWRAHRADEPAELLHRLSRGGPHYIYGLDGPALKSLRERITARFGPPIPDRVSWNAGVSALAEASQDRTRPLLGRAFVPSRLTIVLLGPFLLLATGAAAWCAGELWRRRTESQHARIAFHLTILGLAALTQGLGSWPAVTLFGCVVGLVVLYAVVRGGGFPFYEALRPSGGRPRPVLLIATALCVVVLGGLIGQSLVRSLA